MAPTPGTQFTCFTSTKVQILTPEALPVRTIPAHVLECRSGTQAPQVLSLLALLVQKYKY
jgi:hypothetical protein